MMNKVSQKPDLDLSLRLVIITVTNTLAYSYTELINKKGFTLQAPELATFFKTIFLIAREIIF